MNYFEQIKDLAERRNIGCTIRGNGHVTLNGPLQVHYYPTSKTRSAYVAGTVKKVANVSPKQAIEMCFSAPVNQGKKDKRKGNSKRQRIKLFKRVKHCCWCDSPLTIETSTVEHIIPLDRGGLDNWNNKTLACKACNERRGSDMPEIGDL